MTLSSINDIKRISKVFQSLSEFIGENHQSSKGITVPEHIQTLVLNLNFAHAAFEEGIEDYMHVMKEDLSKVKTVERIIEASPYYLTIKDGDGDLPIHTATLHDSSFPTLIPLLANAGIQHGVGGASGRGGLLLEDCNGDNTLFAMAYYGQFKSMQILLNAEPPLLINSDVVKYSLVHGATQCNSLDLIKMMIEMDPKALYQTNSDGNLPIHLAKTKDIFKFLLESAIKYKPKHHSIGGLFAQDNNGFMSIDKIIKRFGKTDTIACIEQVLSTHKDIPILHEVILHTPEYLHDIITALPDSCFLRDKNDRLPIHVALETGMKWSLALSALMFANLEHLDEVDPVTKLCLSALAAVEPASDLRTINYLMLKHPKNAKVTASTSDQERCKRMKLNH